MRAELILAFFDADERSGAAKLRFDISSTHTVKGRRSTAIHQFCVTRLAKTPCDHKLLEDNFDFKMLSSHNMDAILFPSAAHSKTRAVRPPRRFSLLLLTVRI